MKIEKIKKDIEDTEEIISEEMQCCEHCDESYGSDICDGCGTYGNIRDYEMQLAAMKEALEETKEELPKN